MKDFGTLAELKAANFLIKKHYTLLEANYRSRFGEIDIIAKDKKYLVFVEVKARSENTIATPGEFVHPQKQQRIIKTAAVYLATHPTELQPRFDVIEVYIKNDKIKSLKHLENAFDLV